MIRNLGSLALLLGVVSVAWSQTLVEAAAHGEWERVRALAGDAAAVRGAQADGTTALHWAAHHDNAEVVALLIAAGADAGVRNRYGIPPLWLACQAGNAASVSALLRAGADPETAIAGGERVLMTAARTGRLAAVQALLGAGATVDAMDDAGQTALMWAAAEGHVAVVTALLTAGAERDRRLPSGFTALLFAVREGRTAVVQALLAAGADANSAIITERKGGPRAPRTGTSALLLAIENGHFALAQVLVAAGADVNDRRTGYGPLHALTWVRRPNRGDEQDGQPPPQGSGTLTSLDLARALVAAGANVDLRSGDKVGKHGNLALAGATPLFLAAKSADLPYVELLVALGAAADAPNVDGATPLLVAAGLGCKAAGEEAGSEAECLATVDYLLAKGADVNHVDRNGETAMHGAAYKNLPQVIARLAARGADPARWNRKNKYGWTPLLIAEGFRPGNYKPSAETITAFHDVMRAAGITPPPPTPRPEVAKPKPYDETEAR